VTAGGFKQALLGLEGRGGRQGGLAGRDDGGTLAVAVGRVVQLWNVTTGNLVARLEGHEGKVRCLAYAPDGTRLASGGHDRTVQLWDNDPIPAEDALSGGAGKRPDGQPVWLQRAGHRATGRAVALFACGC
jgi:WD40 repeat protein